MMFFRNKALTLLSFLMISGCFVQSPGAQSQSVRICDETGCSDQPHSIATFQSKEDLAKEARTDRNIYRGEPIEDLRDQAKSGSTVAAYKLGLVYEYGLGGTRKDIATAVHYLEMASDGSLSWAHYRLSEIYLDGVGVPKNFQRGLELLFKASEENQPSASFNLGMLYLNGSGLPRDPGMAVDYLRKAAEAGLPDAQYNLALLIFRGVGATQGLYEALESMRKAAQGGVLKAQTALGRIYMTGLDNMPQDVTEARKWLSMAADRGDQDAKDLLAQILRAEKEQQDYERRLSLLQAQTELYWAQAAYEAWITPDIVTYVVY